MSPKTAKSVKEMLAGADQPKTGVEAFVVTITPEIAQHLLEANDNIRPIRKSMIGRYVSDMMLGDWSLTGEAIIFDRTGNLRNGQHRLLSCVQAGVPFTTLVVIGVDPVSVINMDDGGKRSFAEFLGSQEYDDNKSLAAAVRVAYQLLEEHSVSQNASYSKTTLWRWFLGGHQGMVQDLARVRLWERKMPRGFTRAHMAGLRHAASFAPGVDVADVDHFFAAMAVEETLEVRSPAFVLRQFYEHGRDRDRMQIPERIAVAIRALNLYLAGREASRASIAWRRGGKKNEPFPQITPGVMDEMIAEEESEGASA